MKSYLPYLGSKTKEANDLVKLMPSDYKNYHECFLGSAIVYFNVRKSDVSCGKTRHYYLSDSSALCVNLHKFIYRTKYIAEMMYFETQKLNKDINGLVKKHLAILNTITFDLLNNRLSGDYNDDWLFSYLFLKKHCYLGNIAIMKDGSYKVIIRNNNSYKLNIDKYKEQINLRKYMDDRVVLERKGILECKPQEKDFCYLDPPYFMAKEHSISNYDFSDKECEYNEIQLLELLNEWNKKGVMFMMSNIDSPVVRYLYKDYNINVILSKSTMKKKNQARNDVIITNY